MKKRCILLLAALVTALLGTSALAANIDGQAPIASVYDAYGPVSALTDDSTATTWTLSASDGVDLTINLYGATVGEVWLRSGHCYSQNYYNHYDRPEVVKVTVHYRANQYTTSSDSYRYRLADLFRPNTVADGWASGYQRLLLPKEYSGVTKIELTIESTITGSGRTGATLTDLIVAQGDHATPTPRRYATATPKPYVVYATPTPDPHYNDPDDYVEYLTPIPDWGSDAVIVTPKPSSTPLVEFITPAPQPTEPLVEFITPKPSAAPTAVPDYPSVWGIFAQLKQRIATRSGPANHYDEPGSFFGEGDWVKVISKAWDQENGMWWFQVEFQFDHRWYRAYTPAKRIDLNPDFVMTENAAGDSREVLYDQQVFYGPGFEYGTYNLSLLYKGSKADIYVIEGDWALVEYYDYVVDVTRRGWIPVSSLSTYPFSWD